MTNEDSPRPDPQDTSNAALLDPRLVGVKILPNWLLVFLVALGIIVAIIRGTDVLNDHATANIATWLLTFIAIVTCSVWFLFRSPYPRRVRVVAGVCCLVALGLFSASPSRSRQWGARAIVCFPLCTKPDRQIGHPNADRRAVPSGVPIDLRTTGADDFPQFLGPNRTTSYDRVRPARLDREVPPVVVATRDRRGVVGIFRRPWLRGHHGTVGRLGDGHLLRSQDREAGMGLPNGRTLRDDRGRRRTAEHAHDRRRDGVRFAARGRTALVWMALRASADGKRTSCKFMALRWRESGPDHLRAVKLPLDRG